MIFAFLATLQATGPVMDTGDIGGITLTLPTLAGALRDGPGGNGPEVSFAPDLRNEAIFLRGRVETAAELRRLIARATRAEWTTLKDGTLRLARSPELRKTLAAEEIATRAADLRAAAFPYKIDLAPLTPESVARLREIENSPDPVEGSGGDADGETEADRRHRLRNAAAWSLNTGVRLAERLRAILRLKALADLPLNVPVRFLGAGGGPYRKLPVDGASLLRGYRDDLALVGTADEGTDPQILALNERRRVVIARGELGLMARRLPDGIRVAIYAVGDDPLIAPLIGELNYATVAPRPPESPNGDALWPGDDPKRDREQTVPGNFMPKFILPALEAGRVEPLSHLINPFLWTFLENEKRPVVLDLPDSVGSLWGYKTPSRRENSVGLRRHIRVEIFEGAVIGAPRYPLEASALRLPRSEVVPFFRVIAPGKGLDDAAAYLARVGEGPWNTGLLFWLLRATERAGVPLHAFDSSSQRATLRLWAALRPEERAALDSGATLTTRDLAPPAANALWAVALGGADSPQDWGLAFLDRNGAPPPLALSWRAKLVPALLVTEGPGEGTVHAPSDVGYSLSYQRRGKDLEPWRGPDFRTVKLQPILNAERALRIAWTPYPDTDLTGTLSALDRRIGEPVPWQNLPPEYLAPLQKTLDYYDKQAGGG